MTSDQALKIRFHVLERVVGALIATHPDKAALLRKLEKVALAADALALNETLMSDEAVDLARQEAQEWIRLARDELTRTAPQKPRA